MFELKRFLCVNYLSHDVHIVNDVFYWLGDYCGVEPLDPIPNSPVKRVSRRCYLVFWPGKVGCRQAYKTHHSLLFFNLFIYNL